MGEGKCEEGGGISVYGREVYRNGNGAVGVLSARNLPLFYEATDWKPRKSGVDT